MTLRTRLLPFVCVTALLTVAAQAQQRIDDDSVEPTLNIATAPLIRDWAQPTAGTDSAASSSGTVDASTATDGSGQTASNSDSSATSPNTPDGTATTSNTTAPSNPNTTSVGSLGSNTTSSNLYCGLGNVPKFGTSDGPAAMPQACYYTPRSATPSPNGVKWTVSTATGLTSALAGAACGDIIQITAGSTISGNFTYGKTCSAQKYITIETSRLSSLPREGTRIKPCYAGVSSEVGYPSFNCTSTTNVMAKLITPNNVSVLTLSPGASYLRIIGIEFTRQIGTGINYDLVQSNTKEADHIIFDQVYMHGDQKTDETTRGLSVTGMNYVAVVDSFFSDFWCISKTGTCTDSQAIEGNSTSVAMPVLKIVNNFLAAAAENILLGGAGTGSFQQTDVEIRNNWMYKPLSWYPSSSTYDGVSRITKNLLEFKQCDRCLVEGNVMQNTWSGYSQIGAAILITPKENGVPPCCYDTNIAIRYNYITHACQVFQTGSDPTGEGQNHNTLHDLVADDLTYSLTGNYSCSLTYLTQLLSPPNNNGAEVPAKTVMNNVTVNHLTLVTSLNNVQGLEVLDGPAVSSPQQVSNVTFTNSIMDAGIYGFHTASGGSYSCTNGNGASNLTLINGCWKNNSFDYHVLVRGANAGGAWPGSHNSFPTTFSSVGFVKYNNGVGGDYRLCTGAGTPSSSCLTGSAYHNAASDGKDIGADVQLVHRYIAGVNSF
jgi:hypothetical protein